jgi:hypothetical protein
MEITRSHPLRRLFVELVERHFFRDINVRDTRVAGYVSDLLTEFTHTDNLYKVRTAQGRRLEEVGDMLAESHPLLGELGSFERERAVRKHIGDYTLFLVGVFPESLARRMRSSWMGVDRFVDYVKAGKESYAIVSSFDQFEYRDEAPLFRRLSECFELCVYGLHLVRQDLERFQKDYYRRLRATMEAEPAS